MTRERKPRRTETMHGQLQAWTWHVPRVGRLAMWDCTHLRGEWLSAQHAFGKTQIGYTFRPIGCRNALFSADDFTVPAGKVIDSLEVALSLLDFLCLGRGDTDRDFFDSYSAEQLAWLDSSEREAAQLAVYELVHPLHTVTIVLEVCGAASDVRDAVKHALDSGALQDAVNACGVRVQSAVSKG